jgi:predicted RNA-binding protein with PUA-like domain
MSLKKYWLMKTEPTTFSIDDLQAQRVTHWEGIRNYQARNMMRDEMQVGDGVLFYHSNCATPGIVGLAEIVKVAYPDFTAWDPLSPYFDPKSSPENPRWCMVDVKFKSKLPTLISLDGLRQIPECVALKVLQKGNRLSITPVTRAEWDAILRLT